MNLRRYVFNEPHEIGIGIMLIGEDLNSTYYGLFFHKTGSTLFTVKSAGVIFEKLNFISDSYTQTFDTDTKIFTNSTKFGNVSAIDCEHNIIVRWCKFEGFSGNAIKSYNQSKIYSCIIKQCVTAITVYGYDGQYYDLYITDCQYGFKGADEAESEPTVDIYNLWIDRIKYDAFNMSSIGGMICNALVDHIGRNVIRVTANVNRLYMSGKYSRFGISNNDNARSNALIYAQSLLNSKIDILTYVRPDDEQRTSEFYLISSISNSELHDNVIGSDIINDVQVYNSKIYTPDNIWIYDNNGTKHTIV